MSIKIWIVLRVIVSLSVWSIGVYILNRYEYLIVMENLPVQVPQPLPDASLTSTNSMMKQVSVEWQGVQPALGYSYRYFATVMYANPDVKLLAVNGAEPSTENIQNGSYPFVGDFYAVTNGKPEGNIGLLIDWILSPQGQEIIEKTGYTPLATIE